MPDEATFAATLLMIRDKEMQLSPFIFNNAQRHLRGQLTGRDIILKARQLGMSTFIQARQFRVNVTRTSSIITLSDTITNTQKLRTIYNRFYEMWPDDCLSLRPVRAKNSESNITYPALDSESVISAAGVKTAGQGGTYSHIHGSEIAFWKDVENIFARTLQAATPDAEIILESTPNGAVGKFYELCMRALDGDRDWRLHFYPWWWGAEYRIKLDDEEEVVYTGEEEELIKEAAVTGFHLAPEQIKWRRSKQRELPHTFKQEYPEDPHSCFLGSGTGFFGDVGHAFYTPTKYEPEDGHVYVGGIDWGQSEDWTVLSIGDVTTKRQVAVLRLRRLPWKVMRDRIYEACQFWGVTKVMVEINSIGGVNYEMLRNMHSSDMAALLASLFEDPNQEAKLEQLRMLEASTTKVAWLPFTTTAQTKPGLVQSLYRALHEQGLMLINFKQNQIAVQRAEFAAFQATQSPHSMKWSYEAAKGQHDDFVIATGLMWLMMERPAVGRIRILE